MQVRSAVLGMVGALVATMLTMPSAGAEDPLTTEILDLDASTPGSVTATVTSPGPWIQVSLDGLGERRVPTTGATTTVTMETWGLASTALVAATCSDETAPCYGQAVEHFTATDVTPTVTFTTDGVVGANETVGVTVDDPGDGPLAAIWQPDAGVGRPPTSLASHGTTQVTPGNGEGHVVVRRCSPYAELGTRCVDFDPSIRVHVSARTSLNLSIGSLSPISLNQKYPTAQIMLATDGAQGTYDVVWQLRAGTFAARTGTASGTVNPDGSLLPITIDGAGAPDGDYFFVAAVTVHDPVFGDLTATTGGIPPVNVRMATHTVTHAAIDHPRLWPAIRSDRFPGTVSVALTTAEPLGPGASLRVVDGNGAFVATMDTVDSGSHSISGTWHGLKDSGGYPANGTYGVDLVNQWGNVTHSEVKITVSRARLVRKTYRVTVTPSASLEDRFVGRCSTLRRPSLRRWPGSLGFYANTRCAKRSWKASAVSTVHAVKLPAAAEYWDVQVFVAGGAAKAKPRSRAFIRYLTTKRRWVDDRATGWRMGSHRGARDSATPLIWSDRYFVWGFGTANRARWDARSFTIVLRYFVLEG